MNRSTPPLQKLDLESVVTNGNKTRTIYLDVLRVIACVMVVAMHAPMNSPESASHGVFLIANGYFNSPCVPLFFMVSGALLLPCKEGSSTIPYLTQRISKVIYPTLFFSLLYWLLRATVEYSDTGNKLIIDLLSIPFVEVTPVLWFMYVLIGLYLMIPILSPWLQKSTKMELHVYLGLWLISQLYPWISLVLHVNTTTSGLLYYFSGYVGYFLLGFYIKRYDISLKLLLPLCAVLLPLPVIPKLLHIEVDNTIFVSYLSLPSAVFTITCFMLSKRFAEKISSTIVPTISLVSKLCFGIYLWHILIRYYILDKLSIITNIDNYYIQYSILLILTFMLSLLLSYLIFLLPFGEYIIGCSRRRKR